MNEWSPDHWVMMAAFFGLIGLCVFVLIRKPAMHVPGVPSHDMANRLQGYISEVDQRLRDMPRPREIHDLSERTRSLEIVTTGIQVDVRSLRDSNARIEHQLNLLIDAGLDRDARGAST